MGEINLIERQATIAVLQKGELMDDKYVSLQAVKDIVLLDPGITDWQFEMIEKLPPVQPKRQTCEGCKHRAKWDEGIAFYFSQDLPCTKCKRIARDCYEGSD